MFIDILSNMVILFLHHVNFILCCTGSCNNSASSFYKNSCFCSTIPFFTVKVKRVVNNVKWVRTTNIPFSDVMHAMVFDRKPHPNYFVKLIRHLLTEGKQFSSPLSQGYTKRYRAVPVQYTPLLLICRARKLAGPSGWLARSLLIFVTPPTTMCRGVELSPTALVLI